MRCAWAALLCAAIAGADHDVKPPALDAESSKHISPAGFSTWQPIFLMRDGVVNTLKPKEFNDGRFEYRWKSEWRVNSSVCTVEIRGSGDADYADTIPQLGVAYWDRRHRGPRYIAHDVPVGGRAHASFQRPDCDEVEIVWWNK